MHHRDATRHARMRTKLGDRCVRQGFPKSYETEGPISGILGGVQHGDETAQAARQWLRIGSCAESYLRPRQYHSRSRGLLPHLGEHSHERGVD